MQKVWNDILRFVLPGEDYLMSAARTARASEKAKDWKSPKKKLKFREPWELDDDDMVKMRR